MNEQRITDHAEHCDFYVGNEHYDKSHEEKQRLWTLKFAELIIEECVSLFDGSREMKTVGMLSHTQIIERIEEYFGVE